MNVYSIVQSGNVLFAATDFGVYRSSNNGDQWYPSTGDSLYWPVYSLAESNGMLFAGTSGTGVYRSTDNGNSWIATNNGMPPPSGRYQCSKYHAPEVITSVDHSTTEIGSVDMFLSNVGPVEIISGNVYRRLLSISF